MFFGGILGGFAANNFGYVGVFYFCGIIIFIWFIFSLSIKMPDLKKGLKNILRGLFIMSVNKVILVGRLGQDPDVRYMPNETAVCNFSLATSSSYKDKSGEKVDQTEWHQNCDVWKGCRNS